MRKSVIQFFGIFCLLATIMLGIVLVLIINQAQLQVSDTSVLYGGEEEYGYPAAGFMVAETTDRRYKACGQVVVSNDSVVTAAHCTDGVQNIYLGKGEIRTDFSTLLPATQVVRRQEWNTSKERSTDFAVIRYENAQSYFANIAQIAMPIEGCDYRVVAYGKTDESVGGREMRRSADVCITSVTEDIFFVQGKDAGICFGDSGSPVFYRGTNKVVGIVVSIIQTADNNTEDPCRIGNVGLATRIDANQELITIGSLPGDAGSNDLDILEVEPAARTIIDDLRYSFLQYSPEGQTAFVRLSLVVSGILIGLFLIILVKNILTGYKDEVRV